MFWPWLDWLSTSFVLFRGYCEFHIVEPSLQQIIGRQDIIDIHRAFGAGQNELDKTRPI